jgi:hypothetical protein
VDNPLLDLATKALAAFYAEHVTACWAVGAFVLGYVLTALVLRWLDRPVPAQLDVAPAPRYEPVTEKVLASLRAGGWSPVAHPEEALVCPGEGVQVRYNLRPTLWVRCELLAGYEDYVRVELPLQDEQAISGAARDAATALHRAESDRRKQLVLEKLSSTT